MLSPLVCAHMFERMCAAELFQGPVVLAFAVDDKVQGAVEEEAGPAAVRCAPPGLLDALPVHALGALGIVRFFCARSY